MSPLIPGGRLGTVLDALAVSGLIHGGLRVGNMPGFAPSTNGLCLILFQLRVNVIWPWPLLMER
jgi:hypothetical protein